jgi:hypothetical protein
MKPTKPTVAHAAGTVTQLSVDQLRTSYAALRGGTPRQKISQAAELPLRVVPTDQGGYQVIDGFKRLARWRELGLELVPVVIERPASTEDHKRLLLEVNAPPRTLTALDEARVVCSLIDEDGKTEAQVARVLSRKKAWVARRVDIGRRLSPAAEQKLAEAQIGPSLAHALCSLEQKDQDLLLSALDRQGLGHRKPLSPTTLMVGTSWALLEISTFATKAYSSPRPCGRPGFGPATTPWSSSTK